MGNGAIRWEDATGCERGGTINITLQQNQLVSTERAGKRGFRSYKE